MPFVLPAMPTFNNGRIVVCLGIQGQKLSCGLKGMKDVLKRFQMEVSYLGHVLSSDTSEVVKSWSAPLSMQ